MPEQDMVEDLKAAPTAVHLQLPYARILYAAMPPHVPQQSESTTHRNSIGVSFSGHRRAVRAYGSAAAIERDIAPGDVFLTCSEDLHWLDVREPAEALEIYIDPDELERAARELGAVARVELHDVGGHADVTVWSCAAELRSRVLRGTATGTVEDEELFARLMAHMCTTYGGVRKPARAVQRLDARRLAAVADYVDASLGEPVRLADMASHVALSRFHFLRAFQLATGMSPGQFLKARRMERARDLLVTTHLETADIAARVGYRSMAHFRVAFSQSFGVNPGELRRTRRHLAGSFTRKP